MSIGTNEYSLTKEDIGRRLAFVYIPVNFEGQLYQTVMKLFFLAYATFELRF